MSERDDDQLEEELRREMRRQVPRRPKAHPTRPRPPRRPDEDDAPRPDQPYDWQPTPGRRKRAAQSARAGAQRAGAAGGRQARRQGARVVREATGPYRDTGGVIVSVLGGTLALAILYALIVNGERAPKGAGAVDLIAGSVQRAIDIVIRPVDPIAAVRGGRATTTAAAQLGQPLVRQPSTTTVPTTGRTAAQK